MGNISRKTHNRAYRIDLVQGGWVKRDTDTGRFLEVHSENGAFRARPKTEVSAQEVSAQNASSRRYLALMRLVDR